ncbi:MAG: TrkA family potassium uptake protein [Alphaproteobacteria bacterium]|nr:TrkA family potassium uptake protein [Alphaproteobacteria bacterium]
MARQQALVIGLGQFGMAVARALVDNGVEVLAVDRRADRIQAAAAFATNASQLDATDEAQLAELAPTSRDLVIVAIGDESREASIMVTALLRQMGTRRVLARATDDLHARILRLVGAHEVVHPERAFGERLASRLSFRGILDVLPLGADLAITELQAPQAFVGSSLKELGLPGRFQVTVVALRRQQEGAGRLLLPRADTVVQADDVLVLVGPPRAAHELADRI